uniref:Uncharacterized protein n=1 Tax=Physcomitrium patens TaxID=3218 RepID=A0A2K1KCW6_PHYPA|nr:hypothetical protein PHYPA_010811 [Physcomitrium patens]
MTEWILDGSSYMKAAAKSRKSFWTSQSATARYI